MVAGQFQAFRNPYPEIADAAPYLVVLQSDRFQPLSTVVVAPLVDPKHVGRDLTLRPRFEVEGKRYALNILQIGAMPSAHVGPPVATLDRYYVIQAYDALISGSWS